MFRCLIESPQPKENVLLKIYFENALNSSNRHFMLAKFSETHTEIHMYSHLQSTYSQRTVNQVSFFTQQLDPESPVLFSDSIQDLIDSLDLN